MTAIRTALWSFLSFVWEAARPTWQSLPYYGFAACLVLAVRKAWSPTLFYLQFVYIMAAWVAPKAWICLRGHWHLLTGNLSRGGRVTLGAAMIMATVSCSFMAVLELPAWMGVITSALFVPAYYVKLAAGPERDDFMNDVKQAALPFFVVLAVPTVVGYANYEGFLAMFVPKYGSLVYIDGFRMMEEFSLPSPALVVTVIGAGTLTMWWIRACLLPTGNHLRMLQWRRAPKSLRLALVLYLLFVGAVLRASVDQHVCKLNPGHEYLAEGGARNGLDPASLRKLHTELRELSDMNGRLMQEPKVARVQHAKTHGLVKATFKVLPGLNPKYAHGVFQPGAEYPAYVRFSNGHTRVRSDAADDARAMAIKVMGVQGPRAMANTSETATQDFVLLTSDIFFTGEAEGYAEIIRAATSPNQLRDLIGTPAFSLCGWGCTRACMWRCSRGALRPCCPPPSHPTTSAHTRPLTHSLTVRPNPRTTQVSRCPRSSRRRTGALVRWGSWRRWRHPAASRRP